jgi:hypothetical protein
MRKSHKLKQNSRLNRLRLQDWQKKKLLLLPRLLKLPRQREKLTHWLKHWLIMRPRRQLLMNLLPQQEEDSKPILMFPHQMFHIHATLLSTSIQWRMMLW